MPAIRALAALVTDVLDGPPRLGPVRLVLVDGPAGSGKTTLAARLRAAFAGAGASTALVHMDDLYEGWSGLAADRGAGTPAQRLHADLLEPLSQAQPGRWRRYDWPSRMFAEWHEEPVVDVVVVEGCGAADRRFDTRTSLRVWVQAPTDVRLARGLRRDGTDECGNWVAWRAAEDAHFAAQDTRVRADVRIDGDPTAPHDPDREVVLLEE